MAVHVQAHGLVLGDLLKDLLEVGHILVDIVLQGDDDALLAVLQEVGLAKARVEHKVGQGLGVGHLQLDGVAPLVALDGLPLHVDVGLLLQALEDGAVVGVGLGVGGEVGQAGDGGLFCQGHGHLGGVHIQTQAVAQAGAAVAAAGEQGQHRGQGQGKREGFAIRFPHVYSPFHCCCARHISLL